MSEPILGRRLSAEVVRKSPASSVLRHCFNRILVKVAVCTFVFTGAISVDAQPVQEPVADWSQNFECRECRFVDATGFDSILLHSVPSSIRVKNQTKAGRKWLVQGPAKTVETPIDACSDDDPMFFCLAVLVVGSLLGAIALLREMVTEKSFSGEMIGLGALLLGIVAAGSVCYFVYYGLGSKKPVNICFDNATETAYDVFVDGSRLLSIEPNTHTRKFIYAEFPDGWDSEAILEIRIVAPETDSELEAVKLKVMPAYPNKYVYNIGRRNVYFRHSVAYGN